MRHILLALVISGSANALANDYCAVPVNDLLAQSSALSDKVQKAGCKYSYGDPKEVTVMAHKLRERFVCAKEDRDEAAAEVLKKSAERLLLVFAEICAN